MPADQLTGLPCTPEESAGQHHEKNQAKGHRQPRKKQEFPRFSWYYYWGHATSPAIEGGFMTEGTKDQDIFERLKKLIVSQKGIKKVGGMTPDTSLRRDLEFDSLGLVDLILACEDEFGIEIAPEDGDFEQVDTIQEAVSYLKKRLGMWQR